MIVKAVRRYLMALLVAVAERQAAAADVSDHVQGRVRR